MSERWKQLGLALKRQRDRRGLSQERLAELAGISAHHLGEIELGKTNFSIDVLERLATVLEWDPLPDLLRDGPPLTEEQAREVAERMHDVNARIEEKLASLDAWYAEFLARHDPAPPETAPSETAPSGTPTDSGQPAGEQTPKRPGAGDLKVH